jgi:uncharacterized Fe-S radical SAM superfamily protein PflX
MDQYHPAGRVTAQRHPELNRRVTSVEFRAAQQMASDFGLRRLDARAPHPRLRARLAPA